MSVQAISAVLALRDASPIEKCLLLVLANYANEDMRCWPSQKRLSAETGLSARSMVRAFASLEAKGIVSRERRPRRPDGTRTSAYIDLHLHSATVALGQVKPSAREAPDIVPERRQHSATVAPKPSLEPSSEPSARECAQEDENGFSREEMIAWAAKFSGRKIG